MSSVENFRLFLVQPDTQRTSCGSHVRLLALCCHTYCCCYGTDDRDNNHYNTRTVKNIYVGSVHKKKGPFQELAALPALAGALAGHLAATAAVPVFFALKVVVE